MKQTEYTVGFAFNLLKTEVALILKNRPDWQKGMLTGIGGSKNEGETHLECQIREFKEEAGVEVTGWYPVCKLMLNDAIVIVYWTIMDLSLINTQTDEEIRIFKIDDLRNLRVVPDVFWLIPMAIANEKDLYRYVVYPEKKE